ncbi:MAG: hypothetical protein WDM77_14830 [Steroidobacteraceae bacterium]
MATRPRPLLAQFSWHGIFVFGGLCSLLLLLLVYFLLPESLDILAARKGPKGIGCLQQGHGASASAHSGRTACSRGGSGGRGSLLDLLRQPIVVRTALMGLTYLLFMMSESTSSSTGTTSSPPMPGSAIQTVFSSRD